MSCKQVTSCLCQKVYHRSYSKIFLIFSIIYILCKDIGKTVLLRVPMRTFPDIYHKGISESRNALYIYAHCLCVARKKRARTRRDLTVSNSNEKKFIRPQLTICVVLYEISSYIIIWVNFGISLKCIIIVSAICVSAWRPTILLSSER